MPPIQDPFPHRSWILDPLVLAWADGLSLCYPCMLQSMTGLRTQSGDGVIILHALDLGFHPSKKKRIGDLSSPRKASPYHLVSKSGQEVPATS